MTAQSRMADSVERLSSGMRINRAKDDAAGLGISNALSSQINGANQGVRNLNDGISIVQTAEGAISEASDMAQRILTLATQAKNGSASTNDRKSIVNEMKILLTSINGMSARTKFGDKELLMVSTGATATDTKFQIAASSNSGDTISLTNDAFTNIGSGTTAVTENTTFTITSQLLVGQSITIGGRTVTGTTATATIAMVAEAMVTGVTKDNAVVTNTGNAATNQQLVDGAAAWLFTDPSGGYANGKILVTSTGAAARIGANVTDVAVTTIGNPGFTYSAVQGGAQSAGRAATLNTDITTFSTDLDNGATTETTFQTDISNIITSTNNYITTLNTQRSKLGAFQNQLESSVNNVTDLSVNLSAARSRVQDTDYAQETASLTKGQILQQAATAMLAQANQMPNVILSLLK